MLTVDLVLYPSPSLAPQIIKDSVDLDLGNIGKIIINFFKSKDSIETPFTVGLESYKHLEIRI